MKNKKGSFLGFTGIEIFKFLGAAMSFIVLIIIFLGIMAIWGPKEKAEAASLALMEDLRVKLSRLGDGDSVIISGSLDKDMRLVSFNSDYFAKDPDKDVIRPTKCGSRSNSCICLCTNDRCASALECKGFSAKQVARISSFLAGAKWTQVPKTKGGPETSQGNIEIMNYLNANNPNPSWGVHGVPLQLKSEPNGIYTYDACQNLAGAGGYAEKVYYRYSNSKWEWSPDNKNWYATNNVKIGAQVQENKDLIRYLEKYNPPPGQAGPGQLGVPQQLGEPDAWGVYRYADCQFVLNNPAWNTKPVYYRYENGHWEWMFNLNDEGEMVIASGESSFVAKFSLKNNDLLVELMKAN